MIPVEFRLDPNDNPQQQLDYHQRHMPWLKYLCNNCTDMKIREIYDPAPDQTIVTYEFELPPKKETYYRMKYGNGL